MSCTFFTHALRAQPQVVHASPSTHANAIAGDSEIQIDLNTTLDAATVNDQTFRIFGSQSGFLSTKGTINVQSGKLARFVPDNDYFPGERVFVTVNDVENSFGDPMLRSWTFAFDVAGGVVQANFAHDIRFSGFREDVAWGEATDMDGDGDVDVCMTHDDANLVSVLLNNGNGDLEVDASYSVGDFPKGLTLADFDGDGTIDVAVSNREDDDLSILFNNGAGSLSGRVDYSVGDTPEKIAAADLDGDGDIDLAAANNLDGNVSVLLNNGSGVFAAAVNYATDDGCVAIRATDVDNDGFLDLLTANKSGGTMSFLHNNGNGTFGAALTGNVGQTPSELNVGDLDNDGDVDVVLALNTPDEIAVLLNDGDGTFAAPITYPSEQSPVAITLADLDGDNDLDISVANAHGLINSVFVYLNDGSGDLNSHVGLLGFAVENVLHADFDGDGDIDLLSVSDEATQHKMYINEDFPTALEVESITPAQPESGETFSLLVNTISSKSAISYVTTQTWIVASENSPNLSLASGQLLGAIPENSKTLNFALFNSSSSAISAPITVSVTSGMVLASTTINVTIGANQVPNISTGQTLVSTPEDVARSISVLISDVETATGSLVVTATSGNQTMIPDANITQQDATAATTVFNIQPLPNTHGTVDVTLEVFDGTQRNSLTFTVTIDPVNDPPTISSSDLALCLDEDGSTIISVAIDDVDTQVETLQVQGFSNNQSLLPDSGIQQMIATGPNVPLELFLAANANGVASLTVSVDDGEFTRTTTISVTVKAVNDPPLINVTELSVCVDEDRATTLSVSISDVDNVTSSLQITAHSSNQSLIADASIIQIGATAANVNLQINPEFNQNGTTSVTFLVSDGALTRSTTVVVTVKAVNDPPAISTTEVVHSLDEDNVTCIWLSVADVESVTAALVISATSGKQAVIPNHQIVQLGVTSAITKFQLTPLANANGLVPLTVSVTDGELTRSTVFTITVNPVNDPPTISTIADVSLLFNGLASKQFIIDDLDSPVGSLIVVATSSNQSLFSDASLTLSATAANMIVELVPECDQDGSAQITISVSDGDLMSTTTFTADVAAATTAVVISGATLACPDALIQYAVPQDAAAGSHVWTALGGEIVSGQGSTTVEVVWASGNADRLEVIRYFPNGCTSADVFIVNKQTLTTQLDFAPAQATSTSIKVLDNDSGGLTLVSVDVPTNGTASINGSNVVYTPNAGFAGIDHFLYTVQNSAGCQSAGAIVVSVPASFSEPVNLEFIAKHKNRSGDVRGMRNVHATALSPDGQYVYAAGRNDHSIAIFNRNVHDGTLSYISRVRNNHNGVAGLKYVSDVLVSADGAHLYAVGYGDNSVVAFERDINSGALSFIEHKKNGHVDGSTIIAGIKRPRSLVMAADGRSVYVAGYTNNALALFRRSVFSGRLTYVEHYKDGAAGVDGLRGALGLATSTDGRNVYVTGSAEDKLAVFSRDLLNGQLTFVERKRDGGGGLDGLDIVSGVAASPDGKHVYAAGKGDNALAAFARDAATGQLTFIDCYKNAAGGITGLKAVCGVAVSPDGRHVWTQSTVDNSLMLFKRNAADGTLQFLGGLTDGAGGVDGLAGLRHAQLNNSSQDVYVAGATDNALAQIFRNRAPSAHNDSPGIAVKNSTLTIVPLLNDSDSDGHSITVTAKTHGALGTVSIGGGGTTLQYAAGATAGPDQFTYTIEDGHGGSSTATVTLTVVSPKSGSIVDAGNNRSAQTPELRIHPNPAGRQTVVNFTLMSQADVVLELSDLRGTRLTSHGLPGLSAGAHSFQLDLRDAAGFRLPSGIYILKLHEQTDGADRVSHTTKLLVN